MAWAGHRVFRQQAALDPACQWNELNASLFASTILSARSGPGSSCALCHEADHQAHDCALVFFQNPPRSQPPAPNNPPVAAAQHNQAPVATGVQRSMQSRKIRQETRDKICVSWNKGICIYPGRCTFRHLCATCRVWGHRARNCADTPEGHGVQDASQVAPRQLPGGGGAGRWTDALGTGPCLDCRLAYVVALLLLCLIGLAVIIILCIEGVSRVGGPAVRLS